MVTRYVLFGLLCLGLSAPPVLAQSPPVPMDLVAHASMDFYPSIVLHWTFDESTLMADGLLFRVYRSVDDSSHFALQDVAYHKDYRDYDVTSGHSYYYYVTSAFVHDTTVTESDPSNIAGAALTPGGGHPRGTIAGTVTDSVTGQPLPLVRILFYKVSSTPAWVPQTWSDTGGHYSAVLDTGTYIINAQPWCFTKPYAMMMMDMRPVFLRYLPEWFEDAATPAEATPVVVADSSRFVADFDLQRVTPPVYARVQGTVTDTSGNPLKGAWVAFVRTIQQMEQTTAQTGAPADFDDMRLDLNGLGHLRGVIWWGRTDSMGDYSATVQIGGAMLALYPPQGYHVIAWKPGYLPQWFDQKSTPQDADTFVPLGDTTGIDFSLSPQPVEANSISGMVRDSSGAGVPSRVILIPLNPMPWNHFARAGFTDSLGDYTISNVHAGQYFVLAVPYTGYAPAFYKAGAYGVRRWVDADTVNISGDVTGIDVGVVGIASGGFAHLNGRVRDGSRGIEGANVFAADAGGRIVGYAMTSADGSYSIDGLPSGSVTLLADKQEYVFAQTTVEIAPNASTASGGDLLLTPLGTTGVSQQPGVPLSFALEQNYPNPFNPSTRIDFSLGEQSSVTLKVYNLLGQEVALLENGVMAAGTHAAIWNGRDNAGRVVASGIYFYRLSATSVDGKQFTSLKKMVLLK